MKPEASLVTDICINVVSLRAIFCSLSGSRGILLLNTDGAPGTYGCILTTVGSIVCNAVVHRCLWQVFVTVCHR